MSQAPTLINLPPPPSDPVTPSDAPGTPNSTTTSMSELSTVAIKDGHRGHFPHHQNPQDAERADRISRLAGLERVATTRQANIIAQGQGLSSTPAYFDQNAQPQIFRERSTVGSASATGSVGGRTTWASGSIDGDKMSEDQDMETSSTGGFSDEAASLVGFGEGARTPARQQSHIGSPVVGKASAVPQYLRGEQAPPSPMTGVSISSGVSTQTNQAIDAEMQDSNTEDRGGLSSVEAAKSIMRDRITRNEDVGQGHTMVGNEDTRS
ncbi:hypothetical protein EJ05DRAFT_497474 [Pseudovirgaria hyperparasitica]|uniref:Uncharacterized protein n=1 Tax=Pseudovirgaria hyperparasitica TaxID=470096 RepID=A0A6A6WDW6_9PEZI|nr:uncharacterized protein EJ05DRAFT_497474 [Pseudovirgaria hyperparasitica]KAF2760903.1 hypothetical protein EJ05DRAFT_497474 [Pseudovirgaria hyperparasitica]